ncbi:MAG: response regulator [Methylococcales bacterium]|nr:response regulator [Methylococcales bacterium]
MHTQSASEVLAHLLLVEDDSRLAELIRDYLQKQGFQVTLIERGDLAVEAVIRLKPDLLILDIMLPGLDGLEVCRQIRPDFHHPVLMLTARDEDIDQIIGLELGADDYVIKPVQPRVLLARINAFLRRGRVQGLSDTPDPVPLKSIRFGQLLIKPAARSVCLGGSLVALTTHEFDLLWLLASRAGEVVSREELTQKLRGIEYDGLDRSIDIRASRLRRRLQEAPPQPYIIKTVRGKGYLFCEEQA